MRRPIRDQFSLVFRTHEGLRFHGEFGDPNSAPRPRREIQNLPHRSLTTSRKALAKPGDLVTCEGVSHLLVAQHELLDVRRFLAVQITDRVLWQRSIEEIDPVSRVARDTGLQTLDEELPVVLDPQRRFEEEGFNQIQYRVFTHEEVKLGDLINNMKVVASTDLLGVWMLEVA